MFKKLIPMTAMAMFCLVGSTVAQDAAQSNLGSGTGSDEGMQAMTCADLNEMDPERAMAFLSGYQYALTAKGRASGSGTSTSAATSAEPASSENSAAATGVGKAATTGDVSDDGVADNGSQAILDSCFDAPSVSLDEVLSGAYGSLE